MKMKKEISKLVMRSILKNLSATHWIIFLNVIFGIVFSILFAINPNYISYFALKPSNIIHGKYLWTIVTHMFLHSGFAHLFFNMLSLFFVGTFLERIIGKKRFVYFYLASGIFAALVLSLLSGFFGNSALGERIFSNPEIFGVGASGAIFGLIGLIMILTPRLKVFLILGPLIAIILQSVIQEIFKNSVFINISSIFLEVYLIISIVSILSFNSKIRKFAIPVEMPFWLLPIVAIVPLVIFGLFIALPISNTAHLGGLIVGIIYGLYLKYKYKKKVVMLNRMIE